MNQERIINCVVQIMLIKLALDYTSGTETPADLSRDPNDVHFFLFPDPSNPNNSEEVIYQDSESLRSSRFKPGKPTVFITHGFRSNVSSGMPQTVKNAFLELNPSYNIFVVSWGRLATPLPPEVTANFYSLVIPNVPIVAKRLAHFITFLKYEDVIQISHLYLIGHSLGSHVSGLAGKYIYETLNEKVPRITGLDPAGPLFYPPKSSKNLRKENAHFVDVYHTNMGVLGTMTRDGHADFYPNGGVEQTNCREGDHTAHDKLGRCSHWFAYELFVASMKKELYSCPCTPFMSLYPAGLCSTKCDNPVILGFYCPVSTIGEFYLETSNPP